MKKGRWDIPDYEYENLARHFLPQIQAFFESEDGQKEYEEWLTEQTVLKAQKADNSNLPLTIDWTRYRSNADGSSNSAQLLEEANAIRRSGRELTAKGLRDSRQ